MCSSDLVDFTTGTLPLPKYFGNFYGAIILETAQELAEEYAKQPHTRILGTIGGEVMKDRVVQGAEVFGWQPLRCLWSRCRQAIESDCNGLTI